MRTHTFHCDIITPLFMGNAYTSQAEIRPPAIKGALRFWWRVLYAGSYDSWRELKAEEDNIFGSPNKEGGRSKVIFFLTKTISANREYTTFRQQNIGRMVPVEGKRFRINILDYLAYGCEEGDAYFDPESKDFFSLKLNISPEYKVSVLNALTALSYYGNLGAKSRNGFGKVFITGLEDRKAEVDELLFSGHKRSFTSGSSAACLFETTEPLYTWHEALSEIGECYREARLSLEPRHYTRRRALLAQPVNEEKSYRERSDFSLSRHAKNSFLSILPENGEFRGQILLLPYQYAAESNGADEIPRRLRRNLHTYQADYDKVHQDMIDFFDRQHPLTRVIP